MSNQKPLFSHCNQCHKPSSSIKIKACTGCYKVGYCSILCQKKNWAEHKAPCRRQSKAAAADESSTIDISRAEGNKSVVRLEVRSGDSGEWRDAGPINLLDNSKQPAHFLKDLPSNVLSYLSCHKYKYRHSPDGIDTNLLILLHGAGDTHEPYDKLAEQMELPQTATLAVSARNVELPLNLGYTWFEEMDNWGNTLDNNDNRRLNSLGKAVDWLEHLLCLLIGYEANSDGTSGASSTKLWIPDRIFLLGFSAGACLAMELCRSWKTCGRLALGGAICVAGGTKTPFHQSNIHAKNKDRIHNNSSANLRSNEATDILLIVGSNDETYNRKIATESQKLYDPPSKVQLYVQEGKGHAMIGSRNEMAVVMEFLSKRLVRRMPSMENMTETL